MITFTDLTGKEQTINGCISCEIANGGYIPYGSILYKNNNFIISQDIELPINGFIVISSIRHFENFTDLTEEEGFDLFKLINKTLSILKENKVCERFNIILEEKKGTHFHVWLMPRHKWMEEKFGKITKNIKNIFEYATKNLKTKENLNDILLTCQTLKKELEK